MSAQVVLLRHAKAGKRSEWDGDDEDRPLSAAGRHQAERLVETLSVYPVGLVLTSPFVRCRQTVEPLAAARGLRVEESSDLAEGAPGLRAAKLLLDLVGRETAVLCTHGDVMDATLAELRRQGADVPTGATAQKGGAWVLTRRGEAGMAGLYLPPPGKDRL